MPNIDEFPFLDVTIKSWHHRRKAANITAKEHAKLAGISNTHLSQLENGKIKCPRMRTINDLETVLNNLSV